MADLTAAPKAAELRTRILSALILAPVALGLAWLGGWPFAALLAVAAVAMSWELSALLPGHSAASRMMLAGFAVLAIFLTATTGPFVALLAGVAGLAFAVAISMLRGASSWPPLLAYPYLILPLIALLWLRLDAEYGRLAIFWLLLVVWATDIFAYFAGRGIGGPKIAPRLSPKKTWAGLIGGMFGAGVVGAAAAIWLNLGSPALLALVSAGLAVVAQAGDFFESALKRRAGVKDSGKLIPGHGGILDRVDGLVTAAVAAALIALLHGSLGPGMGVLVWP